MISMSKSNLVDIMLMSASTGEELIKKKIFNNSKVTPAIRMNDTTDIWLMRNGNYRSTYPRPFRSARLKSVSKFANLGLFSMTFSKNVDFDLAMLNAYRDFRIEAIEYKFNHFLEVFNPPINIGMKSNNLGDYINDCIIKAIAGQTKEERPIFLKIGRLEFVNFVLNFLKPIMKIHDALKSYLQCTISCVTVELNTLKTAP